jgi:hypothetical protein
MRELFEKDLQEVTLEDVEKVLVDKLSENYYIEYKSNFNPEKVCEAVCSFANAEGGYLFIGVEENNNESPKKIIGFEFEKQIKSKDNKKLINPGGYFDDYLNNILKSNIDPYPPIDFKFLMVDEKHGLYIVKVMEGFDVPYIDSSGQIQIRQGNSKRKYSEIKDRHTFDKLVLKKAIHQKRIKKYLEPEYSHLYNDHPYVEVLIIPKPFGLVNLELWKKEFVNLILNYFQNTTSILTEDTFTKNFNLPQFNQVQNTLDRLFVTNSTNKTDHFNLALDLHSNGVFKLSMPINVYSYSGSTDYSNKEFQLTDFDQENFEYKLSKDKNFQQFLDCLTYDDASTYELLDIFGFICHINHFQHAYFQLLNKIIPHKVGNLEFDIKIIAHNLQNKIPYYNLPEFFKQCQIALPIHRKETISWPYQVDRFCTSKDLKIVCSFLMLILGVNLTSYDLTTESIKE